MTDLMLPNETLQSQLSAFVDDELPQAETDLFVRRLIKDTELKQAMGRYQLMGEALRAPQVGTHLSRDFSARIAAVLEQQESVAPAAAPVAPLQLQRWLKPTAGFAIAASVALVAVLTVSRQPAGVDSARLAAEVLQPVVLTAHRMNTLDSYVVPTGANAPTAPIPAARLTNYVVAHSEFSSPLGRRNMMTGLLAGDQPADVTTDADVAAGH